MQFHPLYDAAVLLNPNIEKDHINVEDAIEFIESKMKLLGWKEDEETNTSNELLDFLNINSSQSKWKKGPIQRFLDMWILMPNIDKKITNMNQWE